MESQQIDGIPVETSEPVVAEVTASPTAGETKSQAAKIAKGNIAADAAHRRKVQELSLQRERILSERTASPHRRSALASALIDIEEKLAELGWTIHLYPPLPLG